MDNQKKEIVDILGVKFSTLNMQETIDTITRRIDSSKKELFHIITANPEIVMMIKEDREFKSITETADLITPDGIGIVFAAKLKGEKSLHERVTGFDILQNCLIEGNKKGWSIFLLGASEEVNSEAYKRISGDYTNLKIVGRHNGFFNETEEQAIVKEIEEKSPDILVVAMGAPISDKFIYKYKDRLNAKVAIGVGGSLDVIAGKVKRAPMIWQKMHLEWLYRRIQEPSRKERQKKLKSFVMEVFSECIFNR